jgi:MarR family transcriptional regulator, organic hydroperoxide resistance regulator
LGIVRLAVAGPETVNVIVALEATTHRVLERLAAELAELGLSHGEVNVLAQLKPGTTRTVAELQAVTGQRASTLTGVLDRLERRGLIERQLNPHDRRSFTVRLTDSGAEAAAKISRTFRRLHGRALGAVSPQAAKGFFEMLGALDTLADRR